MWLRLLVPFAVAVPLAVVLATTGGYPAAQPQAPSGSGPMQLVQSLNAAVQSVHSDVERLGLPQPCQLRVRPLGGEPVTAHLMSLGVRAASDPGTGELQLFLEMERGEEELLLLATDSWPVWAAARSDIHQLRARCALRLRSASDPAVTAAGAH